MTDEHFNDLLKKLNIKPGSRGAFEFHEIEANKVVEGQEEEKENDTHRFFANHEYILKPYLRIVKTGIESIADPQNINGDGQQSAA